MNKTIFALSIIISFVAGSVMTGTMAFGSEKPNGDPFKAIWNAINELIATDDSLQEQIDNLSTSPGGATYISEDFICEERLIGIFSCTNYCDAGDQAINVYPNDEGMSNLNNGYSWSLLSPTGPPTTFKVLCIDWQ